MKSIVLFVSVLLVTLPVFGAVTLKEVEEIVTAANDKQTAELKEYVNLKTEPIQADVSFVRNWQTTFSHCEHGSARHTPAVVLEKVV